MQGLRGRRKEIPVPISRYGGYPDELFDCQTTIPTCYQVQDSSRCTEAFRVNQEEPQAEQDWKEMGAEDSELEADSLKERVL